MATEEAAAAGAADAEKQRLEAKAKGRYTTAFVGDSSLTYKKTIEGKWGGESMTLKGLLYYTSMVYPTYKWLDPKHAVEPYYPSKDTTFYGKVHGGGLHEITRKVREIKYADCIAISYFGNCIFKGHKGDITTKAVEELYDAVQSRCKVAVFWLGADHHKFPGDPDDPGKGWTSGEPFTLGMGMVAEQLKALGAVVFGMEVYIKE